MKIFGGNEFEIIDGLYIDASYNILTATDGFHDTGAGYTNQGKGVASTISGYMSKPQGTTETGFILKECNGSETTYFCDFTSITSPGIAYFGNITNDINQMGAFGLRTFTSTPSRVFGARLMYL